MLVAENLQETALQKLKSYCRVCLRTGTSSNENRYTIEKDGEVYNYMCECTGLYQAAKDKLEDTLSDDSRFPSHLCSRCYATLKNFKEFRAVSRQTKIYFQGILDGVDEDQDECKDKKEQWKELGTHDPKDSPNLMEHDIVVEQLPICDAIKSELSYCTDTEFNVDFDYEMPIEVQMDSEDGDGIDLDTIEIKRELDPDDILSTLALKTDETNRNPSQADTTDTKELRKFKTKRPTNFDLEFEEFDSHSTESSDDSDFEDKKRKKNTNKSKRLKSTYMTTYFDNMNCSPKTRNSMKAKNEPKSESEAQDEKTENKIKSAMSSDDDDNVIGNFNKMPKNFRETFKCEECKKNFYKKYMYEAHMKGVHEGVEKPFNCQYCDDTFRVVQLLHRHITMRHASELVSDFADDDSLMSSKNLHFCSYCQRPFRRKDHLNEHIRAVHKGLRPFVCKICGKTFGARNTQLRHEKNHSNIRPYACEYCGKRYNYETELKVHLQRHTTSPDLLCHICKRAKPNAEELKKHIAMHEASRQHQCPKCGKVFTKLFHLREHDSAVHLKLRPFKCNQCDATFGIRKTLKTHERRHDPTDRPEYCGACNLYFKTKRSLVLHMKKTHPTEEDPQEKHPSS